MSFWRPIFLFGFFLACVAGFYHLFSEGRWPQLRKPPHPKAPLTVAPGTLAPTGGQFFFTKILIPVAVVSQRERTWAGQPLAWGQAGETIGSHGCALVAATMVMQSYGLQTDPRVLNDLLIRNKGYTAEGWLMWERVPDLAPGHVRFVYEGPPNYPAIDSNLKLGNPVIVRLRLPTQADGKPGLSHFVVICGKEGLDYLIADPGPAGKKGLYPLKEFGSNIEALRYYERIIPPRAIPVSGPTGG